jgi:hypothetical protein
MNSDYSRRNFLRMAGGAVSLSWGGLRIFGGPISPAGDAQSNPLPPTSQPFVYGTAFYWPPNPPASVRREMLKDIAQKYQFNIIRIYPPWSYYNPAPESTHGVRRQRTCSRVVRVRHAQQATDVVDRIDVRDEARRAIWHRSREDSMLYISAVGCVAEKTVEVFVLLEPRARNHTTLDWQERLAVSARESIQFEIPCLSKERLQNAGRSDVQITKGPLVLDEILNGGSEFHWRPPNPKLETS